MKSLHHLLIAASMTLVAQNAVSADAPAAVTERLQNLFPEHKVATIEKAPVEGFYEAIVGSDLFYISSDGNYLLHGNLYDVQAGLVNLTEARRDSLRGEAMAAVSLDEMIIFAPEKKAEHTITVFTDIDCGYCRKLHREMEKYNDEGIAVQYLFYPRSGPGTQSFAKAESVWCADNQLKAMDMAKAGKDVEPKKCENPVLAHYELGQEIGVSGTPALVLDDGQLVPGYVPADRLKVMLDARVENDS